MRAGTLSGTSNSGTILTVGTPDFSTGHRSRSTTSTWNSRSQCELTANPLSGKLGADHARSPGTRPPPPPRPAPPRSPQPHPPAAANTTPAAAHASPRTNGTVTCADTPAQQARQEPGPPGQRQAPTRPAPRRTTGTPAPRPTAAARPHPGHRLP